MGNWYNPIAVFTRRCFLRLVISTVLSCWLGFLACVLGCAQPISAAASCGRTPVSELAAVASEKSDGGDSCCHRKSKPSEPQTVSCCPLDATLIQKQNPASPPRSDYVAMLTLLTFSLSNQLSVGSGLLATPPHEGRDILLQIHVLRI
jgi:hypothetical protein